MPISHNKPALQTERRHLMTITELAMQLQRSAKIHRTLVRALRSSHQTWQEESLCIVQHLSEAV